MPPTFWRDFRRAPPALPGARSPSLQSNLHAFDSLGMDDTLEKGLINAIASFPRKVASSSAAVPLHSESVPLHSE